MPAYPALLRSCFTSFRTASRNRSFKFSAITLLALWIGIFAKHIENRAVGIQSAERDLENFVLLAEENVLRSIGEMDKAILYLRRIIEAAGEAPEFHRMTGTTDILSDLIVQIAIIDEAGIMRASSVGPQPAPPTDLSDREHYRFHIGRTDDTLFISKPLIGRASGKWSVQLARRFKKPNGSFGGVIVASFNPGHFKRSYGRVNLGQGSTYALIGHDGVVRALSASDELIRELGQDIANTPLGGLLGQRTDAVTWVSASGGKTRLMAAHSVAGHSLHVVASLPEATVFAASKHSLLVMIAAGLVLSLLIGTAGYRFGQEEKARADKDRELCLTLEHMTQGIMLVTKNLDVPVMNVQCVRLLGLPEDTLRTKPKFDKIVETLHESGEFVASGVPHGMHPLDIFGPKAADGRFESYERTRPNGTVIEVRSTRTDDGGFVRTFSDITERCKAQAHANKLAAEDALTGLANRRMLMRTLDLLVDRHESRNDKPPEFAVLYVDLDRFKVVNDMHGHSVGDQLLILVAERLRTSLRPDDFIARLGGDEFAILLKLHKNEVTVDMVAQRLVDTLSRPYDVDGLQLLIGVSIGIALALRDGSTSTDLLVAADIALYAAKSAGRCTFRYFSHELNEGLRARQELESELRQAIADKQLELHYQPIISLKDNRLIGFEALARWKHKTLGMIPPDKFIPIAEECGLIQILGHWAIETACLEAARWPDDLSVAVNLSPLQFTDPGLVAGIDRALTKANLNPSRLEIEVTEGLLMKDTINVLEILRKLKEIGVRIAMDDFGTGYSSLAYLQRFDFDRIKVDRCFVNKLGSDSSSIAIVRAVIDIAASRGMHTTAEGVETEAQRADLAALGCDEAQGYLFSRPVAAEDLAHFIDHWQPIAHAA